MRLSFKKDKPETGLAAVGQLYPQTLIKGGGKEVGYIAPPTWQTKDNKWSIHIAVDRGDTWEWRRIKKRFDTEPEAREFIKEHWAKIIQSNLHVFED